VTRALLDAASTLLGDEPAIEELSTSTFVLEHCDVCGYVRLTGSPRCQHCLSLEAHVVADEGRGSIWSYCVYHRAFDPAFAAALPYNVVLIELDAGPRLISNVLDVEADELAVGARVVASIEEVRPGRFLVYFRLDVEGVQAS